MFTRYASTTVLIVCVVYCTYGHAQDRPGGSNTVHTLLSPAQNEAASDALMPEPQIEIQSPIHDFGPVKPNMQYMCRFRFRNAGSAPLKIEGIQSTCRCTVPELDKTEYAPGEQGFIIVHVQSSFLEGAFTKHLYVLSNTPRDPRAKLTINATIVLPWKCTPDSIKLDCQKEDLAAVPLTIRSTDNRPFRIIRVASSNEAMTAAFDPNNLAAHHVLHPKPNVEVIKTINTGWITIETSHPDFRVVRVHYAIQPEFEVFPQRIILFNVDSERECLRQVAVTNNYGRPFKIASVTSPAGVMRLLRTDPDGATITLTLAYQPPDQAPGLGHLHDEIEIAIDGNRTFKIPCDVWLADAPTSRL
jgi:hypothetical protein